MSQQIWYTGCTVATGSGIAHQSDMFDPDQLVLPDGTIYLRDPGGNLLEVLGWPPQNANDMAGQTGHPEAVTA